MDMNEQQCAADKANNRAQNSAENTLVRAVPHKERGAEKLKRIPIKVASAPLLRKPEWIRVRVGAASEFQDMKSLLRSERLHTVCEEASCPNMGECFGRGTAAFMILGDVCTRRCPFCDVAHGRPLPVDDAEADHLARAVAALNLRYVVITSVDRDDLSDGGAAHFAAVTAAVRASSPNVQVEILVPDFRGRVATALAALSGHLPDVFNHNLETVPRLYKQVRPGADYIHSLELLREFAQRFPQVPTKSGLMVGLGETDEEIYRVMADLRAHEVTRLTIGQYLPPSRAHLPVARYVPPATFAEYERVALSMGFAAAACAPMVRSSYWADRQAGMSEDK